MALSGSERAEGYIEDVLSGKIPVCKYVRAAVDRHLSDLRRAEADDPGFPYYFEPEKAERKIRFSESNHHVEGEWANPRLHDTRIRLEPWQCFIEYVVYGWRRKSDNGRRFSKVYLEVARKNGKTIKGAVDSLYHLFADGEPGAQVYFVASKKEQAMIGFRTAEKQIRKLTPLRDKSTLYKQTATVLVPETGSFMRPLGRDSNTEDGHNPHFSLVDEYHAHKTNEMLEIIESGQGARRQPMIEIITTAGYEKSGPCYSEERQLVVDILEKNIDPAPENYFGIIYTLDEKDDWTDKSVWIKANPNIGLSPSWDFLEKRVAQALASPSKQNDVLTKNFNIWTQARTRWIGEEAWELCTGKIWEEKLRGRRCAGALDLSTALDVTAWCLVFPPDEEEDEGRYKILARFFIPEEDLRGRSQQDKVPYDVWVRDGYICATPGNVIDYRFIEDQIRKDSEKFDIIEIAYDPWNANEITGKLEEDGHTMIKFRQGFGSMSAPSKEFEKKILQREINHGGNPVLRWMVSCTEIASDPAGNIKPVKPARGKSSKRIDGVITAIMALNRAMYLPEPTTMMIEGVIGGN